MKVRQLRNNLFIFPLSLVTLSTGKYFVILLQFAISYTDIRIYHSLIQVIMHEMKDVIQHI